MTLMQVVRTMGLLGLTLALVGLYGLIAYSISRRTQEIGIRMAIGADKMEVLKMVLRQGLVLVAAGIAVGALISLAVARMLAIGLAGLGTRNIRAAGVPQEAMTNHRWREQPFHPGANFERRLWLWP